MYKLFATAAEAADALGHSALIAAAQKQNDDGDKIRAIADLTDDIVKTAVAAQNEHYYQKVKIKIIAQKAVHQHFLPLDSAHLAVNIFYGKNFIFVLNIGI